MKKLVFVLVLAMGIAAAAWGENALSIAELTAVAEKGNLDLINAGNAVKTAAEALAGTSVLESSKLGLSGSYGTGQGASEEASLSGKAEISVPILAQLGIGATASSQGDLSASVNLSPFASGAAAYKEKETYRKAVLQLSSTAARLRFDVQAAAYSVMAAEKALTAAQATSVLEDEKKTVAEKAYELERIAYEDLRTRRSAALSARQGVFDAEKNLLNARVALYRLLGPQSGEPEVRDASAEELSALIAERDAELSGLDEAAAGSTALAALLIERESLAAQLEATPAYSPSLSLQASIGYPSAAGSLSYSAGISFSFSPSDIKADERATMEESIADKDGQISLERMALRFQLKVLNQALSAARTVLAERQPGLAQAETNRTESAALLKQGHVTSLEDRQSGLDLESARAGLFSAMTGVLKAQADLLLLW